jgi:hypothetical protein
MERRKFIALAAYSAGNHFEESSSPSDGWRGDCVAGGVTAVGVVFVVRGPGRFS